MHAKLRRSQRLIEQKRREQLDRYRQRISADNSNGTQSVAISGQNINIPQHPNNARAAKDRHCAVIPQNPPVVRLNGDNQGCTNKRGGIRNSSTVCSSVSTPDSANRSKPGKIQNGNMYSDDTAIAGARNGNTIKTSTNTNISNRDIIDAQDINTTIPVEASRLSNDDKEHSIPSDPSTATKTSVLEQQSENEETESDIEKDKDLNDILANDYTIKPLIDTDWGAYIDADKIRIALLNDAETAAILAVLTNNTDKSLLYTLPKPQQLHILDGHYCIKNGSLYYRPRNAYIIPPKLRYPIMQYCHTSLDTMHQGAQRLINLVRNIVYWKGINKDIINFVAECKACNVGKRVLNDRAGYMKLFEASKPFEVVHMDIVGPLPVTRSGNRFILTMMDRYSRMIKMVPLPTVTANCIAMEFRQHWLLNYGIPEQILTDRGTNFTGLIFNILRHLYGFKALFTTSYHPRTNGRLERFHRYLKERLRVLAASRHLDYFNLDDWDHYIANIAYSYNITPHSATKYAQYSVIYSPVVNMSIDHILKTNVSDVVEKQKQNYSNPTDWRVRPITINAEHRSYIDTISKYRKHLQREIKDNMDKYNTSMKAAYDKKREAPQQYRNAQEVYVDFAVGTVANKRKLSINRKRGQIIDKISANTYVICYDDGRIEPVNVDRLYTISKATTPDNAPKQNTKNFYRYRKRKKHKYNTKKHIVRSKKRPLPTTFTAAPSNKKPRL